MKSIDEQHDPKNADPSFFNGPYDFLLNGPKLPKPDLSAQIAACEKLAGHFGVYTYHEPTIVEKTE